jgi:hypothetical protein
MTWNPTYPTPQDNASEKANKDGNNPNLTNLAGWRSTLDVHSTSEAEAASLALDQARAARPGWASDGGTANRRIQWQLGDVGDVAGSACAIGVFIRVPTVSMSPAAVAFALCGSGTATPTTQNNALAGFFSGDNLLISERGATGASDHRTITLTNFRTTYSGQLGFLEVNFSAGNVATDPTLTWNGADISAASVTTGSAPNWLHTALDRTNLLGSYNWPAGEAPVPYVLNFGGALADTAFATMSETGRFPAWCYGAASMVAKKIVSALTTSTNDFSGFWRTGRKYAAIVTSIVPDGGIFSFARTSDGSWLSSGITEPGTYIFESNSTSIQFRWNGAGASSSVDFYILELGLLVDPIPQRGNNTGDNLRRFAGLQVGMRAIGGRESPVIVDEWTVNSSGSAQNITYTQVQPAGTTLKAIINNVGATINSVGTSSGGTQIYNATIASGARSVDATIASAYSATERTLYANVDTGANGPVRFIFE